MDNAVDDGGLLHAYVADGNQEAFAALVNRHARMVHGVCREVLGDSITADDAVQETFLALMRRASELKRDTPLAARHRHQQCAPDAPQPAPAPAA